MSQNPGMNAPYGQQPGYPAPGLVPPSSKVANVPAGVLSLVGGIVAIVSAFLTWATVVLAASAAGQSETFTLTVNGLGKVGGVPEAAGLSSDSGADGYFAIAAGILALMGALVTLTQKRKAGAIFALVGGVVALGVGIYEISQKSSGEGKIKDQLVAALGSGVDVDVQASIGIGIWLVIVGGAIALIGGILGFVGGRKRV